MVRLGELVYAPLATILFTNELGSTEGSSVRVEVLGECANCRTVGDVKPCGETAGDVATEVSPERAETGSNE